MLCTISYFNPFGFSHLCFIRIYRYLYLRKTMFSLVTDQQFSNWYYEHEKQQKNDFSFAHIWDMIFTMFSFCFLFVFFCLILPHLRTFSLIECRLCVAAETPQLYSCWVRYFSRHPSCRSWVIQPIRSRHMQGAVHSSWFRPWSMVSYYGCINTRCSPII